jgi:hypothetical protein
MKQIYKHSQTDQLDTSPSQIVPILMASFNPKSVIDVGCGVGNWLEEFKRNHVVDLFGIDGHHLDKGLFMLDQSNLLMTDMNEPFKINRRFDLAISLEVAEHLKREAADNFVSSLCSISDLIVFSAAIPGQGGQNHLNEQWPSYWKKKFESRGFGFYDVMRPKIWNNEKVQYCYKQNIFIASKTKLPGVIAKEAIMDVVHPQMLSSKLSEALRGEFGVRVALKTLFSSLDVAVRHRLRLN